MAKRDYAYQEAKPPVDKDNTKHYINNKEFLKALIEYQADIVQCEKDGKKKPYVTEYIAMCFLQIAQRLSYRPNFINYTYKDDMVSDGLENCLAYMHNFNPDKSTNPFAYFTQIIYYAFLRRIQKEKKQQYVKYKYFDQRAGFEQMDELQQHDKESFDFIHTQGAVDFHSHIKEFIDDMERKEAEKKSKREAKKAEKEEAIAVKENKHNLEFFMQ